MFNYRSDKTGFFAALALAAIAVATVVATGVLLLLGDLSTFAPWIKFTLGLGWVLCIGTVLVRVAIFAHQRRRRQQAAQANAATPELQKHSDNGAAQVSEARPQGVSER